MKTVTMSEGWDAIDKKDVDKDESEVWRSALLPLVITRWQPDRVGVALFGHIHMERSIFQRVVLIFLAQAAAYIFAILKAQFS